MKIKTLIAVLLCTSTIAQSELIDLTPGGYDPNHGLPPAYYLLIEQIFFDAAAHGWFDLPPPEGLTYLNGWVGRGYGELDGGKYFFTNLFTLGDTPSASIWWNFGRLDYGLTMLYVYGRKPDGTTREHIYAVKRNKQRRSPPEVITLDGMTFIQVIGFYGTDSRGRKGFGRPVMIKDFAR